MKVLLWFVAARHKYSAAGMTNVSFKIYRHSLKILPYVNNAAVQYNAYIALHRSKYIIQDVYFIKLL